MKQNQERELAAAMLRGKQTEMPVDGGFALRQESATLEQFGSSRAGCVGQLGMFR